MRIEIPELAVVAVVGVSSSGKSTFAQRHFKPTEILSSDFFRAMVSDDENNEKVTRQAFDTLYYVANKRLDLGLLTVIDATNIHKDARAAVLNLAKEQNVHAVAIVLNLPEATCVERHAQRSDRSFPAKVIHRQMEQLRHTLKTLKKEGFRYVHVLNSEDEIAHVEIHRTRLWNDKKDETGPFDIIGDVHGCYDELCSLLDTMGYAVDKENHQATPPSGRRAIFVGDLCDRGPKNTDVLRLVMSMVNSGAAYCVAGNHDAKLVRILRRGLTNMTHGIDITMAQLDAETSQFRTEVESFLDGLISHYVFDGGRLVVAHAGLIEKYHGRSSGRVRSFCLYGDTTGETDEYGLPVRLPWANDYRGSALVVYGHVPTPEIEMINNTVCIDTGCVFGGKLTGFRYPEKEVVQIEAAREYYTLIKPLHPPTTSGDLLNVDDVLGQRFLSTTLRKSIKINAENSAAALEVMSRFAADPRWLIYLPPTMSPCETSTLDDYLEDPSQAFEYYRKRGVTQVVCERKHMGSRAVIILCRDESVAQRRFRIADGTRGIIYTRTGRRFFEDDTETTLLTSLDDVLTRTGFWDEYSTDWVCLDAELMPWSAKAQGLLREQFAPVSRAGSVGLAAGVAAITSACAVLTDKLESACLDDTLARPNQEKKTLDLAALAERYQARAEALDHYAEAYRRYCWEVTSIEDYRIAPFHILATEGHVYSDRNHLWHMETIAKHMTGIDPIFMATDHLLVDLSDEKSTMTAIQWWQDLTASGGEGMVVKPLDFIGHGDSAPIQPAVKCRGREYLRIIYGPEYLLKENLPRLKKRSLSTKRRLALQEFALGMESLDRFVNGDPLHRVHECIFGVLALESEPVDPRL
ncbi:MAG: polynucleotide kinase-phosphatase [Propionibacteriaceae bacterium]|jgi:protein phosphatase|nr:polynucleotide kinase-phosphatase [Propionibacteriaceae bacterium]